VVSVHIVELRKFVAKPQETKLCQAQSTTWARLKPNRWHHATQSRIRIYVPIVDMVDTYDGRTYDLKLNGAGLHAIEAATGKVIWHHKAKDTCGDKPYCDPGVSAAVTAIPGAVLAGHLDGILRGYDRRTGQVLWSYDTTKPVKTISGAIARGGSMSGPGPAAYNGYLVVNSGYGLYFHMPGNVLLVFEKSR
jgi:polyvinyl alcohol dehydrogenase (cytochrome)